MSTSKAPITISTLKFIKPTLLASTLTNPTTASTTAIIDVRDNDYIGGHIKGCQHVPINQFDARLPELLRVNKDKQRVVFHCMLSQQRGPKAALMYARAKQAAVEREQGDDGRDDEDEGGDADGRAAQTGKIGGQEVCVLEGGFGNWQALYGEDVKLTEGYVKDLWE